MNRTRAIRLAATLAATACIGGCVGDGDALPFGTRAEDCGACHAAQHAEWSASRHAASAASPVFEALLPRVADRWGTVARDRCLACHAPGHGGDDAIGCVSCHAAVGNRGEQNAALVVDLDAPLAGPFAATEPTAAHQTTTRALLASPVLCGTCHEVRGPGLLDEPTLSEYRASAQAREGRSCVDCHMRELNRAAIAVGATEARPRREHRFAGVDPAWGATPDEQARATTEAQALLASALSLSARWIDATHAEIRLDNVGAGHDVPTGAAFLRDIWVDARVVDAAERARDLPRVIELGARMLHGDREVTLPTDADRIEARGLASGDHRSVVIELPGGDVHGRRVEAVLRARAVRSDILESLGLPALGALEVGAASSTY